MSLVEIRCASCGATIDGTERCGEYRCTYCGAFVINIVDATVKTDVEIVSPEEMDAYIAKNRKSFVIKVGDRLEEFDVETKIINKKIADAEECLKSRNFSVYRLDGIPDSPVVLRLRLLHQFKVRNEYELSMISKSISENENFKKLMAVCDETTRATYKIIEEEIARNIAAQAEIKKVDALVNAGLCEDAFVYATEMLKKHPCRAIAHSRYFYAKYNYLAANYTKVNFWDRLIRYKHRDELKAIYALMKRCPDFEIFTYRYGKRYEYDYEAYQSKWAGDDAEDYPLYSMYLTLLMMEKHPGPDPEVAQYLKDEAKREKKEKKLAAKAAKAAGKAAKKAAKAAKKGK